MTMPPIEDFESLAKKHLAGTNSSYGHRQEVRRLGGIMAPPERLGGYIAPPPAYCIKGFYCGIAIQKMSFDSGTLYLEKRLFGFQWTKTQSPSCRAELTIKRNIDGRYIIFRVFKGQFNSKNNSKLLAGEVIAYEIGEKIHSGLYHFAIQYADT